MSIQQQAMIDADPAQVYAVLADAEALSALLGMSGAVGRSAGEEFSAFDGHVVGRQIGLVPGERIVQTWRFPAHRGDVGSPPGGRLHRERRRHGREPARRGRADRHATAARGLGGRQRAAEFLAEVAFRLVPEARFVETRANRQPALAVYTRDDTNGLWHGSGLLVITVRDDQVAGLTRFESHTLRAFGLPRVLPDDDPA
jgi:uncharacterized protein YndB with AHSA1/START domain